MINDNSEEKVFYEPDGRIFKKEHFIKSIPRKTFVIGRFSGKFHADIIKNLKDNGDFFDFKIYEAEVEILNSSRNEVQRSDDENSIKVEQRQMPEEVFFYKRIGDDKLYYDIKFENPVFRNFQFVSKLQQNEGEEAFGTIDADFYGYLVDFIPEERYRKIYKKINLVKCERCIQTTEKTGKVEEGVNGFREEFYCKGKKETYWGEWNDVAISEPPKGPGVINDGGSKIAKEWFTKNNSPCLRNLFLAVAVVFLSLIFGFGLPFTIGLIWLIYIIYKCYFHWIRYFAYFFGLLFLIGLVYSLFNTDWSQKPRTYIPHPKEDLKAQRVRPELIKVISLIGDNDNTSNAVINREMTWFGYNGEEYKGNFRIRKSDLDASRNFKNSLTPVSYESILYNIENHDSNKINDVYEMFNKIKKERNLNDKKFAEMIVSFIQYMPYYVVLERSCNPEDYQEQMVKDLIKENPGRCAPNQAFGITTPLEFLATGQGDCDSRTLLAHTVLKHFGFNAAILSSDVYSHSILGINLPYNGQVYEDGSSRYVLWETTDKNFKPGIISSEVRNLNYWKISIK